MHNFAPVSIPEDRVVTFIRSFTRWLLASPMTGKWALVCSLVAVVVPTLLRASVDSFVSGIGFSPYVPFVLLSAVFLGSRHAAGVAIASAIVADLLFVDPRFIFIAGPTDVFGMSVFLVSSALMICLVQSFRTIIETGIKAGGTAEGIIFSLKCGEAWASWPGASYFVRLGRRDEVSAGMKDFLAQVEVGKSLTNDNG